MLRAEVSRANATRDGLLTQLCRWRALFGGGSDLKRIVVLAFLALIVAIPGFGGGQPSAVDSSDVGLVGYAPPDTSCADVLIIGARGSGQPASAGMGPQARSLAVRIRNSLAAHGRTSRLRPLTGSEYAAHHVASLLGVRVDARNPYFYGISHGRDATIALLYKEIGRCDDQRYVLLGYSQGAMVMHRVISRLTSQGRTGVLSRIDGVGLIADGDRAPRTRANLVGDAGWGGRGIAADFLSSNVPPDVRGSIASRTWEICKNDDLICDFNKSSLKPVGLNPFSCSSYKGCRIHTGTAYLDSTIIRRAATGIVGDVRSRPKPIASSLTLWAKAGEQVDRTLKADVDPRFGLEWSVVPGNTLPQGWSLDSSGSVRGAAVSTGAGTAWVRVRSVILGVRGPWVKDKLKWRVQGAAPAVRDFAFVPFYANPEWHFGSKVRRDFGYAVEYQENEFWGLDDPASDDNGWAGWILQSYMVRPCLSSCGYVWTFLSGQGAGATKGQYCLAARTVGTDPYLRRTASVSDWEWICRRMSASGVISPLVDAEKPQPPTSSPEPTGFPTRWVG